MTETVKPREIEEPAAAKPAEEKEDWKSFGWFLVKLVIIVFLFRTLAFTSFNIPSESMMPRLLVGDYLFAQKWSYGYSRNSLPFDADVGDGRLFGSLPERGDIVIFKHPIDNTDYIKRAIGLPGDTVQMIDGVLHLNGEAVRKERVEDFLIPVRPGDGCYSMRFEEAADDGSLMCRYPQFRETLPNGVSYNTFDLGIVDVDNTAPLVVPDDHVFMMGDNRDNSQDSRRAAVSGGWVGLVPVDNLVAEASFMYWSTDGHAEWVKPWTWFTSARWSRMFRGI
ncbi:signal peptidase I [Aurantiacibacter gangjinensis]|uniref:Signal peptidase I n=1 Tax=Aurantiacibacter gangjinensis TaxID=502682 RepID=A0A0G9MQS2_9SPHN|nr:signal peptidase I [Aurantiacibacter gangjinensis]APE28948.1 Signal peptidase I [Aurantiacibacter gangjinensis]KLE33070.1 signal peptidase [Aurantiacibacter gangjinensis]